MEILEQNLDELFDLNPFLAEIYSNHGGAAADVAADDHELKMSSINCWSGQLETLISPSSSISVAAAVEAPQLISFEKEEKYFSSFSPTNDYNADCNNLATSSQIISFSSSAEDDRDHFGKKERVSPATRTPSQAQEHVVAERKRRQNLGQLFIALSKVVPGLKKLDKASLLEDAINYLKALQERVTALEKEEAVSSKNVHMEDVTSFPSLSDSSCELAPVEISVRISDKHVLIKICCKKQMGLMSRIPSELEKIHLSVIDMRIMPFGGGALDVTILAEMQREFIGTVKEIVDHLQAVLGAATRI